jgi:hypothetical protein
MFEPESPKLLNFLSERKLNKSTRLKYFVISYLIRQRDFSTNLKAFKKRKNVCKKKRVITLKEK